MSGSADRLLTRAEVAAFLTDQGFPISRSTLDKLCMTSRSEGPPPQGVWGHRHLYNPQDVLRWAKSRFRSAASLRT